MRGEVTIEVRTDFPEERFQIGAKLQTDPPDRGPLTIASARDHSGILVLSFEEAKDRNEVEKLRNTLLLSEVDPAESNTSPDDFHISQIIGAKIIDENGKDRGVVVDVLSLPAQDTLVINYEDREVLVPFVKSYVPTIDIDKREIHVNNFEGLL